MGSNRRRRRRRQQGGAGGNTEGNAPRFQASMKPAWRQTLDSWGGFTVVGAIGLAVIFIIALIVFNRPGSSAGGGDFTPIERSQVDGRVWGNPSAPVHIIAFEDFQCPYCKAFTDNLEPQLAQDFIDTGIANLEFRHLAFLGPDSVRAAQAAECALDQNRFWEYHDLLFLRQGRENTGVFSNANLKDFGRELQKEFSDFNLDDFDNCVDSNRKSSIVQDMRTEANGLGITSTPSFFINGQPFGNTTDYDTFRAAVQSAADAAGG